MPTHHIATYKQHFLETVQFWLHIPSRTRRLLQEISGILLISIGVTLLLYGIIYTPLLHQLAHLSQESAGVVTSNQSFLPQHALARVLGLTLGCISLGLGYFIFRRYVTTKPNMLLWLIVIEVLAETSILGWLLIANGLALPLPSGAWGMLSTAWLQYFFGALGAFLFPLIVLSFCLHFRRRLRKTALL